MNNPVQLRLLALWHTLTEVPGWPDAPRGLKVRRALPVVIPIVALGVLALWTLLVTGPAIRSERVSFQPLQALEQEVLALAAVASEAEAAEFASRAAGAQEQVIDRAADAPASLEELTRLSAALGWTATFQALPVAEAEATPGAAPVQYLPVRGKLTPAAGNPDPFASLLALTERFSSFPKRIDLTRLAVRADDEGRHTAEVQLRFLSRTQP